MRDFICVKIIEAGESVLGPYSPALQEYAEKIITRRTCYDLILGKAVKEVRKGEVELADGETIPCGMVVWSTGVRPVPFVDSLKQFTADYTFYQNRLVVDSNFRLMRPAASDDPNADIKQRILLPHKNVYAIGDCAVNIECPLP